MRNPPPDAAPWCAAHATAFDFKTHERGQWNSHPKQGGGGYRYKGQATHSLPTSGAVAVLCSYGLAPSPPESMMAQLERPPLDLSSQSPAKE